MKVAHIVPPSALGKVPLGTAHLLLPHLMENGEYEKFYAERRLAGDLVIMDNGAFEHMLMPADKLLELAQRVANEIVLPDVLRDPLGSIIKAREAYEQLGLGSPNGWSGSIMIVPQGRDSSEWIMCMEEMLRQFPRVTTIGIFEESATWFSGTTRLPLLAEIHKLHLCTWPQRSFHLLGMQEGTFLQNEIILAREYECVRSIDSGKCFVYGMHKIGPQTMRTQDYPGRPKNFFEVNWSRLSLDQRQMIDINLQTVVSLAGDHVQYIGDSTPTGYSSGGVLAPVQSNNNSSV
jgi:hypothetical protein